jgi:hypothetical protein
MKGSIYVQRETCLAGMPAVFSLAEFRAAAGLPADAAWQTCRHWAELGLIGVVARGIFQRRGARCLFPAVCHIALAAGGPGYFTGRAAWRLNGLMRGPLTRLDLVGDFSRTAALALPGAELRRHALGLARRPEGIREVVDGGRQVRVAGPERVLVDAVAEPGRFMDMVEVVAVFRRQRRRFDAEGVLELAARFESEAVRRRLRAVASATGLRRLPRWLDDLGAFSPGMGPIRLDPTRPAPHGLAAERGVILNVPFPD